MTGTKRILGVPNASSFTFSTTGQPTIRSRQLVISYLRKIAGSLNGRESTRLKAIEWLIRIEGHIPEMPVSPYVHHEGYDPLRKLADEISKQDVHPPSKPTQNNSGEMGCNLSTDCEETDRDA